MTTATNTDGTQRGRMVAHAYGVDTGNPTLIPLFTDLIEFAMESGLNVNMIVQQATYRAERNQQHAAERAARDAAIEADPFEGLPR